MLPVRVAEREALFIVTWDVILIVPSMALVAADAPIVVSRISRRTTPRTFTSKRKNVQCRHQKFFTYLTVLFGDKEDLFIVTWDVILIVPSMTLVAADAPNIVSRISRRMTPGTFTSKRKNLQCKHRRFFINHVP